MLYSSLTEMEFFCQWAIFVLIGMEEYVADKTMAVLFLNCTKTKHQQPKYIFE